MITAQNAKLRNTIPSTIPTPIFIPNIIFLDESVVAIGG